MLANSGDSDQTPQSAASDLGLHCLSLPHKKDGRLTCIWVNIGYIIRVWLLSELITLSSFAGVPIVG